MACISLAKLTVSRDSNSLTYKRRCKGVLECHPHINMLYLCTLPKRTLAAVIKPDFAIGNLHFLWRDQRRLSQSETCIHWSQIQHVALQTRAVRPGWQRCTRSW